MNGLFGSIGHEETEWDPCHCQLWSTTGMHEQIVRGANQANETEVVIVLMRYAY